MPRRENRRGGFLGDHVDRADDEKSRDSGKYRRIHNTQARCMVYAEIAVQYASPLDLADGSTSRSMVAPAVVADEGFELWAALYGFAWQFLFFDEALPL